jgi:hypothetical protein
MQYMGSTAVYLDEKKSNASCVWGPTAIIKYHPGMFLGARLSRSAFEHTSYYKRGWWLWRRSFMEATLIIMLI